MAVRLHGFEESLRFIRENPIFSLNVHTGWDSPVADVICLWWDPLTKMYDVSFESGRHPMIIDHVSLINFFIPSINFIEGIDINARFE